MGVRQIATAVNGLVQRGDREVVWSPQAGLGFGNMLYAYLYTAGEQARGHDCRVLDAPVMTNWFERYPGLRDELTIARPQVSWRDKRRWVWYDHFGEDFSRAELNRFIEKFLLENGQGVGDFGDVVVNVRRGDYYDTPRFRGRYSFDIASYVDIALSRCAKVAAIDRIVFVSDGLDWCRLKLNGLARRFTAEVEYFEGSPQDAFALVATTPRLVGTNSSFSYWAGYISEVIHDARGHVVMPRFHARLGEDWSAYQLDPAWDIVEEIPGGWNA